MQAAINAARGQQQQDLLLAKQNQDRQVLQQKQDQEHQQQAKQQADQAKTLQAEPRYQQQTQQLQQRHTGRRSRCSSDSSHMAPEGLAAAVADVVSRGAF